MHCAAADPVADKRKVIRHHNVVVLCVQGPAPGAPVGDVAVYVSNLPRDATWSMLGTWHKSVCGCVNIYNLISYNISRI